MDRLSDRYLVRTSESLYSVQSMANIRIRLIFDSSNTLVNRHGPTAYKYWVSGITCHMYSREERTILTGEINDMSAFIPGA